MAPECVSVEVYLELDLESQQFESFETCPGFAQLLGENWVLNRTQFNATLFFSENTTFIP